VSSPLSLSLTASQQRGFARLAADLERVLGARFTALVAYGPTQSAAFAASIEAADLDALSALVEGWHRDGVATPLVMTADEFRRSLDVFPLEFQALLDRHVVIAGRPPFDGASVASEDLRRACEVEARGYLIHLRQGWLQAAGHEDGLGELLERSAAPFRSLLANVARLQGLAHASDADLASFAERTIGLRSQLALGLLSLDDHPERRHDLAGQMTEFLASAEALWHYVDRWRSQ
jgi:hypothetical protein